MDMAGLAFDGRAHEALFNYQDCYISAILYIVDPSFRVRTESSAAVML